MDVRQHQRRATRLLLDVVGPAGFARQLALVTRLSPRRVAQYGVDEIALAGVRARLTAWSQELLAPPA